MSAGGACGCGAVAGDAGCDRAWWLREGSIRRVDGGRGPEVDSRRGEPVLTGEGLLRAAAAEAAAVAKLGPAVFRRGVEFGLAGVMVDDRDRAEGGVALSDDEAGGRGDDAAWG